MRKTLKLLTLTGVAYLIAWTTASAQFDSLPEGLPTGDVTYLGDNQFTSETLGDFELDTSIKNRVIHTVLGPMVWEWNESTEVVTLHTEWWGDLQTHTPGTAADKVSASGLGFEWPYVKSAITGATYFVNVKADTNDAESTPFYNHRQVNGQDIGWQHSIGIDLYNAANYYTAAETIVGQMQTLRQTVENLQNEYVNLAVSIAAGQGPIDEKFAQVEAQFLALHDLYTNFVFYYHRCSLAPVWAARVGMDDTYIALANAYVKQLPTLEATAVNTYANAQEILYNNCASIKAQKTAQLNTLIAEEAARQAAAAAAAANSGSSGSSSSSGGSSTGTGGSATGSTGTSTEVGGSDWESARVVIKGATDVFSWKQTINLKSVSFSGDTCYFPASKPTPWTELPLWNVVENRYKNVIGNVWVIQNVNGTYWAYPTDWFASGNLTKPVSHIFVSHLNNYSNHQSPMYYKSGQTYGLMVTTHARLDLRSTNERSQVILFTMP